MKKIILSLLCAICLLSVSGVISADIIVPPFPLDMDECKQGGWEFLSYNGVLFKNQGDCVSFVATDYRNLPDGAIIEVLP